MRILKLAMASLVLSTLVSIGASAATMVEYALIVESSCTKESKTCEVLIEKENLPKGKECGTPAQGLKWKVPESVPKAYQKEAAALADRANKGELKGFAGSLKVILSEALCEGQPSPFASTVGAPIGSRPHSRGEPVDGGGRRAGGSAPVSETFRR